MFERIRRIDLKMFLIILVTLLIPTIYVTVRINFISNIPDEWGFSIASQLQWINVMIEVLQEALIFQLFFLVGKTINDKDATREKIVSGLIVVFGFITIFAIILGVSANALTSLMNQSEELIPDTVTYIRYELVGIVFANMTKFLLVIFIEKGMYKGLISILSIQTVLTIILDYIFLNQMNIGVNAIAYTNIIVQSSLFITMLVIIFKMYEINILKINSYISFSSLKEWGIQGGISGLESFVRNAAFIIMVLKIANEVGESGTFWIMNNFIWGWILLPVLALADVIKNESSKGIENVERNFKSYFTITAIFVGIWIITIPLYKPFLSNVLGLEGEQLIDVLNLSLISLSFYVLFAFNNIIDSICYGIGKVELLLYQSLIVNIVFYGAMFILYKTGIYEPTLYKLAIMMATGVAIDSIITFIMFKRFAKKEGLVFE